MGSTSKQIAYFTLGLLVATALLINSCQGAGSFYNPILDTTSAQEYIYLHTDGFYYMVREAGSDLYLYKSEKLSDWRLAERKIIHTYSTKGSPFQPEIHFLSGNWYIYFYVTHAVLLQNQLFVIKALNPENPFGQYSDEIRLPPAASEEGHDEMHGTVLELKSGSLYFIYAGLATSNTGTRKLFIAPMSNPTTISGPRTLIRDTMTTWDTELYHPQILRENENGNQTFLVFTGGSGGGECLGLMGIDVGKDPLVAANWWHYPNGTVFASNPATNVFSPGAVSFTYSPDFSESWMAYRAKTSANGTDLTSRLEKIEWNNDRTPRFPTPTALSTPLPLPSGEILLYRFSPFCPF